MPFHVPPVSDERDAIAGFLALNQDGFRAVAYGLTDAQAGTASTPSALTVGTLVKHLTQVQENWLAIALAAPQKYADERPQHEQYAAHAEGFTWHDTDTLMAVFTGYDDVSARVIDAVRTLDPDTPVPVPDAPWNPQGVSAWSVRWVWLHLLQEITRHAGHADIIREAVDGATMYELIAGRDGLPETPWLKPWRAAGES